jgi:hypothetical protein
VSETTPPPEPAPPVGQAGAPHYRLDASVELKQPPSPKKGTDWLAWVQASTPILLALVGLYFTDTVRTGFERQQLQLANASGMQGLLVQLLSANVSQADARAAASTLAAFGPPAVAPLITALADADDVRTPAIEAALRAIGLNNAAAVCDPLMSILERRTGRYSWLMHRSAVRVIGDVRCPSARTLLQSYSKVLADGSLKTFDPATEEWVPLSPDAAELLKADVDRALADAQ